MKKFSLQTSTLSKALSALSVTSLLMFTQNASAADLPTEIQVPAGNSVAMTTSAVGNITWECKDDAKNPGKVAYAFAGPRAVLNDAKGNQAGSYYGPPATWEALDGSAVTGKELAVSPSKKGSIPMQLVQANPSTGTGVMNGVTYIQRINLEGGSAPTMGCSEATKGHKVVVNYAGDYVFWKAN